MTTDAIGPALICCNINARTKFWTESSLVMKGGFTSKAQAEKDVGLRLEPVGLVSKRNLSTKRS